MVMFWSGTTLLNGQSLKSKVSRSAYRLGTLSMAFFAARTASRTEASLGSPTTSPRGHRFPVIQEDPLENVIRVRLQRLAQKGQMRLVSWVYSKFRRASHPMKLLGWLDVCSFEWLDACSSDWLDACYFGWLDACAFDWLDTCS